eukprot:365754-Chlamydomonas_euryale.AAC.1
MRCPDPAPAAPSLRAHAGERVAQTVAELAEKHGADRVVGRAADVSDGADVRALAEFAKAEFGKVDMGGGHVSFGGVPPGLPVATCFARPHPARPHPTLPHPALPHPARPHPAILQSGHLYHQPLTSFPPADLPAQDQQCGQQRLPVRSTYLVNR